MNARRVLMATWRVICILIICKRTKNQWGNIDLYKNSVIYSSMQTLHEEIHFGRTIYSPAHIVQRIDELKDSSAKSVESVISPSSIGGLELELHNLYAAQNTDESQKKLLKFLGNPNKIRNVLESALREILKWFSWEANVWSKSVQRIRNLINEELQRRANQANIFIKR